MGSGKIPRGEPLHLTARLGVFLLLATLLLGGIGVVPSTAALLTDCIDCHHSFAEVHGVVDHNATPPSGTVRIFAATDHYPTGNFEIPVDCKTCHALDVLAVHANNCANCHPTPYASLGTWERGCQQGGCHATYHEDVLTAHKPFADPNDSTGTIRCENCHSPDWTVTQSNCLNCHASYGAGDLTPPITTVVNAQNMYSGAAKIVFSITDNGKVGIGTTFYRLDGGVKAAGSQVVVNALGLHQLEFWSVDQAGNVESPSQQISFTIYEDTTPPTTTSDALGSYNQAGIITFTATDDSAAGVKNTYYTVNGGPVQTGTVYNIPATNGVNTYTLTFWSVDWAGNIETPQSVTFTVTIGSGILRLIWSNAEADPSTAPAANDRATWYVYSGGWAGVGTLVTQGSSAPGWNGVNDVSVPVSSTPYFVRITWYVAADAWQEDTYFPNINVTTPGQLIRLNY